MHLNYIDIYSTIFVLIGSIIKLQFRIHNKVAIIPGWRVEILNRCYTTYYFHDLDRLMLIKVLSAK